MASLIKWVPWLLTKVGGGEIEPSKNEFINEFMSYDCSCVGP
jgi:hypothetical protein